MSAHYFKHTHIYLYPQRSSPPHSPPVQDWWTSLLSSGKRCSCTGATCKRRVRRGPVHGPSLRTLLAQQLLQTKQGPGRYLRSTMAIKPSKVYICPTAIWWSFCCLNSILKGEKSAKMHVCSLLSFPSPWISDLSGIKTKSGARKALSVLVA